MCKNQVILSKTEFIFHVFKLIKTLQSSQIMDSPKTHVIGVNADFPKEDIKISVDFKTCKKHSIQGTIFNMLIFSIFFLNSTKNKN